MKRFLLFLFLLIPLRADAQWDYLSKSMAAYQLKAATDDSVAAYLARETTVQKRAATGDSVAAYLARETTVQKRAAMNDSVAAYIARDTALQTRATVDDSVAAYIARTDSLATGFLIEDSSPNSDLLSRGVITYWQVDTNAEGIFAPLHVDTDGHLITADASSVSTMPCIALAAQTGTGYKQVLLSGFVRNDAWDWTPGALIYVSATTGTLTATAPATTGDQVQIVGIAVTGDIIDFRPDLTYVEAP